MAPLRSDPGFSLLVSEAKYVALLFGAFWDLGVQNDVKKHPFLDILV